MAKPIHKPLTPRHLAGVSPVDVTIMRGGKGLVQLKTGEKAPFICRLQFLTKLRLE